MHIVAAISADADSPYASATNTFKLVDGFARLGHDVTLVCFKPRDPDYTAQVLRSRFALSPRVKLAPFSRFVPRAFEKQSFARRAVRLAKHTKPDLLYLRDHRLASRVAQLGVRVAIETHHGPPYKASYKRLFAAFGRYANLRTFVTISPALRAIYAAEGVPGEKLLVLPSGVDLHLFERPDNWQPPRPGHGPKIVYSGHLWDYKGIPTVLGAARLLPDCDFTLIGGDAQNVAKVRARVAVEHLTNVRVVGHLPYTELPQHFWNADVLLCPPSANHRSAAWTSPVKLGEYLASGTPVVASAIPALKDLVTDTEVCFFQPDDAASLAAGIRRVISDKAYAASLSASGLKRARLLSYTGRAQAILDHSLTL